MNINYLNTAKNTIYTPHAHVIFDNISRNVFKFDFFKAFEYIDIKLIKFVNRKRTHMVHRYLLKVLYIKIVSYH